MMSILANIGVAIVAILHVWFCILEMYFWTRPLGMRSFKISREFAYESASLAANQGIYNAFLSAGLIWGLLTANPEQALHIKIFFLSCVIIAGLYASFTVNRKIFFIQAMPAIITSILLYFSM